MAGRSAIDRVGAFRFEPVAGAAANDLPDQVPEAVKEERYARLMEKTEAISAAKLAAKVGRVMPVIIDEVGEPTRMAISAPPGAARPMRPKSTVLSICAMCQQTFRPETLFKCWLRTLTRMTSTA
jgi:tRNA A37 methylthiotransferase MiaB